MDSNSDSDRKPSESAVLSSSSSSSSSVLLDHYRLFSLRSTLTRQEVDVEEAREIVDEAERNVLDAQDYLHNVAAVCENKIHLLREKEVEIAQTESAIAAAVATTDENDGNNHATAAVTTILLQPETGLPLGEKIAVFPEHRPILDAIIESRLCMAEGNVDGAREKDVLAASLKNKSTYEINPRAVAVPYAYQVSLTNFVEPYSLPSLPTATQENRTKEQEEEEQQETRTVATSITTAIEYAKEHVVDEDGKVKELSCGGVEMFEELLGLGKPRSMKYPKGVNHAMINEIRTNIVELRDYHRREYLQRGQLEHNRGGREEEEDGSDDDHENENENEQQEEINDDIMPSFRMDNDAWESIEFAMTCRIGHLRDQTKKELELPHAHSAKIARYNHHVHFSFESPAGISSVNFVTENILRCKLRERPRSFLTDDGMIRQPFEIRPTPIDSSSGGAFDIDGDLMVSCGDLSHNSLRGKARSGVAFGRVPVAVNLDESKQLGHLKDSHGSNLPWDQCPFQYAYKENRTHPSDEIYNICIADATNDLVWASSATTGTVHAFSTNKELKKRSQRPMALLSFHDLEKKAVSKLPCTANYNLVRGDDDTLVGSAGTPLLSVWNSKKALEEFPGPKSAGYFEKLSEDEYNVFTDDEEEVEVEEEEDEEMTLGNPSTEHTDKKQKSSPYKGLQPHVIKMEDTFCCGDVQWLDGSEYLVAPVRRWGGASKGSLRVMDLESGKTTGIFCGIQSSDVSIEKQSCFKSNNLIFSMEQSTGFVWDARTYQPVFALHTGEQRTCCYDRILGVPTQSDNPIAFTFGSRSESIACWDLRNPASHVYTMSTGNTTVSSLHWHDPSSTLIAAVNSSHVVTYGYSKEYMYGEVFDEDESGVYDWNWYPPGAEHEKSYFGEDDWHCDCSNSGSMLLMYSYENGKNMNGMELLPYSP